MIYIKALKDKSSSDLTGNIRVYFENNVRQSLAVDVEYRTLGSIPGDFVIKWRKAKPYEIEIIEATP